MPAHRHCHDQVEHSEGNHEGDDRAGGVLVGVLPAHVKPDGAEYGQDHDSPDSQEPRLSWRKLAPRLLRGLVQQGSGLPGVEGAAVSGGGGGVRCGVHGVSLDRLYAIK